MLNFSLCTSELFPRLSVNTTLADVFTPCLTFALLPSVPAAFALLSFLVVVLSAQFYTNRAISLWTSFTRLKLMVTIASTLCSILSSSITSVFFHFHFKERRIFEILDVVFCLFALSTHRLSLKFGYVSNGCLHIGWMLRFVALVPVNVYLVGEMLASPNFLRALVLLISLVEHLCALAQIALLCYPDTDKQTRDYQHLGGQPASPFEVCSAAQQAVQSFAGDLLKRSFRQKVSYEDYWQLEKRSQATQLRQLTARFGEKKRSMWAFLWLLLRVSWYHQLLAFFHSAITLLARYFYYVFLSSTLEFCSGEYPYWLAVFPAVALMLSDIMKNVSLAQLYMHGNLGFYNIRSATIAMIFDKMLKLSPSAQTNTATGVILNYVTVDVVHSRRFWGQLCDFMYCPAVMIVALTALSYEVGFHNMAYGLVVLIICQAISTVISKISANFTETQMEYKDKRLKLINDILNGIRVLKLYGWEGSMEKMVARIRQLEVKEIFKSEALSAIIEASFDTAPLLATLATFYGYIYVDGAHLTPKSAFVSLLLFDMIRFSVYKIPQIMTETVTTLVSMRRLLNFLNEEQREESEILPPNGEDEFAVELSKATFSWTNNTEAVNLADITMSVRPGQLVAVMGNVASGKSTLLAAIAGELRPLVGDCRVRARRMAYVPQQAWIQNMTLRDNVLFDAPFDADFYERTLDACALRDDVQLLPGGDLTEIGERGINLSGGQKARVSLARAVYQRADFYVLDDPLSAVDSHVGRQIFTNVIANGGLLDGATRIVAVNSTTFLDKFDLVVCLKAGKATYVGPFSGLRNQSTSSLASQISTLSAVSSSSSSTNADGKNGGGEPNDSGKAVEEVKKEPLRRIVDEEYERDSLIEEESFRAGRISYGMYREYVRAFGVHLFILFVLFLFVGATSLRALANIYMAEWSTHASNMTREESLHNLVIYGVFGLTADLCMCISLILIGVGCYRASKYFHSALTHSILCAPMSYFDRTPLGRIINRFSKDTETLDTEIAQCYSFVGICLAEAIRLLLSVFIGIPYLIPAVIPLFVLTILVSRYFNAASAQFRRIASNSMSKVCSAIQDAYAGASSIRVYRAVDRFRSEFAQRLDRTAESNAVEVFANCWMLVRMDVVTDLVLILFLTTAIWFTSNQWITLGFLGMIVNSTVSIGGMFGEIVWNYRDAETEIVCIERIKEYIELEREPIWRPLPGVALQPHDASVEFERVSLRYREQDEPVIREVSFRVEPRERVGIVGRTGAGKTSLTSLLFRLVKPFEGVIRIGGVDIREMGPSLRRILTIIPQDPVLFCGSLRSNLDPFEEYSDEAILAALRKAHLSDFMDSLVEGLRYEIADGGSNLSVGQRQLVCLARALLRATKILVLDEATASVDPETDQLIQQTIRENFSHCTILTIAHRLNTVIDYDKILVMRAGRVAEFASPASLLADPTSLFHEFARLAGLT